MKYCHVIYTFYIVTLQSIIKTIHLGGKKRHIHGTTFPLPKKIPDNASVKMLKALISY